MLCVVPCGVLCVHGGSWVLGWLSCVESSLGSICSRELVQSCACSHQEQFCLGAPSVMSGRRVLLAKQGFVFRCCHRSAACVLHGEGKAGGTPVALRGTLSAAWGGMEVMQRFTNTAGEDALGQSSSHTRKEAESFATYAWLFQIRCLLLAVFLSRY